MYQNSYGKTMPESGKKSVTFNNPFKLREKKRCKFVSYASISRR